MIYFDWFIIIFHNCYNLKSDKNFDVIINIMLYIPMTDDYLKTLSDEEVEILLP